MARTSAVSQHTLSVCRNIILTLSSTPTETNGVLSTGEQVEEFNGKLALKTSCRPGRLVRKCIPSGYRQSTDLTIAVASPF